MTLKRKLIVSLVLALVIAAVSAVSLIIFDARLDQARTRSQLATELVVGLFESDSLANEYIQTGLERPLLQWQQRQKSLHNLLDSGGPAGVAAADISSLREQLTRTTELMQQLQNARGGEESSVEPNMTLVRRLSGQLNLANREAMSIARRMYGDQMSSGRDLRKFGNRVLLAAMLLLVSMLAAVLLLSYWHVTKPVQVLMEAAGRIARGDFSARVPSARKDEVGQLGSAFNEMADKLHVSHEAREASDKALREAHSSLEKRVEERTTELKQEVAHRTEAERIAKQNEDRLVLAMQIARMGAWELDVRTNVFRFSRTTFDLLGREPTHDYSIGFQDVFAQIDEADRPGIEKSLQSAIATLSDFDAQGRIRRLDNKETRWMAAVARVLSDDRGRARLVFGVVLDVTDRREAELQMQRAKETAESANRAKDEFLAIMSHELRTPLTAMLGWVRMMRTGMLDAEKTKHGLEVLDRNINVQKQLIEDLLDVSRIVTGKLVLKTRSVDPKAVVEAALETVKPTAEAKNIRLHVELAANMRVHGDQDRLQQVAWNLLTNAMKFTPLNGHVYVTLRPNGTNVELRVSDTGVGISPDVLPLLFERFRQADTSTTRRFGGLGLGLAIVRHVVEMHGGTVHGESEGQGKGATFVVMLPARRVVDVAVPGAASTSESHALEGLKVLVVDDEPDARDLLSLILNSRGAQVDTAESANSAMLKLQQDNFDLLISDIGMPEEDGYSLARKVRELPGPAGQIPALALSAFAREEDRLNALAAGFQRHMAKPVEPAALVHAAEELMRSR